MTPDAAEAAMICNCATPIPQRRLLTQTHLNEFFCGQCGVAWGQVPGILVTVGEELALRLYVDSYLAGLRTKPTDVSVMPEALWHDNGKLDFTLVLTGL